MAPNSASVQIKGLLPNKKYTIEIYMFGGGGMLIIPIILFMAYFDKKAQNVTVRVLVSNYFKKVQAE